MNKTNKLRKKTFAAIFISFVVFSILFVVFWKKWEHLLQHEQQSTVVDNTFIGWSYALPDHTVPGSIEGEIPPLERSDPEPLVFDTSGLTDFSDFREKQPTFFLENGDLYDLYGGGREFRPDSDPADQDNRFWIDARLPPLKLSSRLSLYGVSTLTLGDAYDASFLNYTKNYGVGGGLGFSYKISDLIELNFDFRHTKAIETSDISQDPATDSAGFSIKLKF